MKKRFFVGMAAMALGAVLVLAGCDGGLTNETDAVPTEMRNGTQLTSNTWGAVSQLAVGGVNYYKFTATAATQYIHFAPGTLTDLYVRLYDSKGAVSGSSQRMSSSTKYVSMSVAGGSVYYMRVWPYSSSGNGTYKIAFNSSVETPDESAARAAATTLSFNTWAVGELAAGGVNWYKFTATAATQYIHFAGGVLTSVYVQLYDSAGNALGSSSSLSGTSYVSRSVAGGSVYYIKVWPYSSGGSGTYKITFNASVETPEELAAIANARTLSANTWANGNLAPGEAQWFKFTATANNQYIHVAFDTLTDLYVLLHNSSRSQLGNNINLYSSTTSTYQLLVSGNMYYIKVWPYSNYSGTYKISFNASATPPN
jgi:hypothetical protein